MAYYSITLIPALYILYLATGTSVVLSDVHQATIILVILELVRWFFQMFAVNIYAPEEAQSLARLGTKNWEHKPHAKRHLLVLRVCITIALWLVLTNLLQDVSATTISTALVFTLYLFSTFYWVLRGLENLSQRDLYYVWHTNGMRIFLLSVVSLFIFLVMLAALKITEIAVYYTIITSVGFLVINDLFLTILAKKIGDPERVHRLYRRAALVIIFVPIILLAISIFT